jgi:uncharacterized protein involved in exopolysaccharide biosynthesis
MNWVYGILIFLGGFLGGCVTMAVAFVLGTMRSEREKQVPRG